MSSIELPKIGLGTWQLKPDAAKFSTIKAIEMGYRFIDTAQVYKNEQAVGEALDEIFENTSLSRSDVTVATKIDVFNLKPKKIRPSFDVSLKKLRLDFVDILYVHWPAFFFGYKHGPTLKVFSELVDEGKVKHIGLSNFSIPLLEAAQIVCEKPIFAHQIEHHPLLQQKSMRDYLAQKNIKLIAYSPLARGQIHGIPEIEEIAKKHEIEPAQVSLAWLIHHGAIPIPKASSVKHLQSNLDALKVKLDADDIAKIDGIKVEKRLLNPPVIRPKW